MKKHSVLSCMISALGLWLIAAPFTFGCPSLILQFNEVFCGIALVGLGCASAFEFRKKAAICCILIGIWLQLSPLIFWAPDSSTFLNETLVGLIVIALAFSYPGMMGIEDEGAQNPPGWSFNPSSWKPRLCTMFLALVCWFLSRYLAAFQLGYIPQVWDPFFHGETEKVLTSSVAQFFPVSDAGLGAFGYSMEFFLGWIGNHRRWRTMPWMVIAFGIMVIPAGAISILLIVLQPIIVGAWCGLCLIIAACMLVMIVLTIPEVVAVTQFLFAMRAQGESLWKVLWHGKSLSAKKEMASSDIGIQCSWRACCTAVFGAWLMFSPSVLGVLPPLANSDYIAGPLLITISAISCAKVAKKAYYANLLVAVWLLIAPWVFAGFTEAGFWNNTLVSTAVLLLVLTMPKAVRG